MMPDGSAEDKPATCYPYATASLAGAFQGEASPLLHFWGSRQTKAVKCFSSLAEFLRYGQAFSTQFPGMLDHLLPRNRKLLDLALSERQFSTFVKGHL